ncbi:hypothetical protein BESB_032720 [Besnoitia besnoiti]|uniref:Uncharacterized protein n=1 Tax=Besnoitia besnoiti TaxID=94643 RepID=A0A2A9LZ63_BESBE|nr:uncharacterized protein BESB_032720 [Besnoitia besnoiti]PFH31075.1 hypothetical protein BESB_032720 [Besnoitia besnoiti]
MLVASMSLWHPCQFAAAGALIDCLTCQRPARDFNTEKQFRMENALRMYPTVSGVTNKAVFTTTPLKEEAIRQGLIHVPEDQVYSHSYVPPLGAPQQLVSVRQHGHTFTPIPLYSGPLQYVQKPPLHVAPEVCYQSSPTMYTVTQQATARPRLMTPLKMPYRVAAPDLAPSTVQSPSAAHPMQAWEYVVAEPLLADTTGFLLTESKAVQVGSEQRQVESAGGTEKKEADHGPESDESLLLVSTNHTDSMGEEGLEQKKDKDAMVKKRNSVSDDEDPDVNTKSEDAEQSKGDATDSDGKAPRDAAKESKFAGKAGLEATEFAPEAPTTAESSSTTHSNFQEILETTRVAKLSGWPVGYVPPSDPQEYKELRIGSNVYLIGGTFYLSDTGAYLLGLRN